MAASHFLSVSDVSSLTALEADGRPLVQQYDRLLARLEQEAPELAGFFAEPVTASRQSTGAQIAWYSRHEGPVVAYPDLPAAETGAASAALVALLDRLRPLLRDPEFGAFLGHCLVIPRLDDVVMVGGNPVLRNWGYVVAGAKTDDESLARLFNATLGRFAGYPQPPWRLQPPPAPAAATPSAAAPPPEAAPPADDEPPIAKLPSPPRTPWWRRPVPALSVMVILLILGAALSYLVAEERQPKLTDAEREEIKGIEANRPILDQHLTALKDAREGNLCSAAGADAVPVDEIIIKHHLERSVGWVLVQTAPQIARGPAFLIAPDLVVTQRRAIADVDPHGILIVFTGLGGAFPAEPVAQSPAGDDKTGQGFAVLKLQQPAIDIDVLALTPKLDPRAPVYTASYPTYFFPGQMRETLEGSTAVAPIITVTSGVVEKIDGSVVRHSAPVWKGSVGAPLLDRCGRVAGIIGADDAGHPTTATGASLIAFLKGTKLPFVENDVDCLAKPALAAAAKP